MFSCLFGSFLCLQSFSMSGLDSVSSMPFSVSHCVCVPIPFVPFVVYILFGVHIYGSYFEVTSFASCLSSRSCLIAGECILLTPCWSFPHQPSGSPSHCLLILAAVLQMFSVFGFNLDLARFPFSLSPSLFGLTALAFGH